MSEKLQKEGYYDRQPPVVTPATPEVPETPLATPEGQETPEQQPVKNPATNFFKVAANADMNEFVKHMQQPRETIQTPEFMKQFDETEDSNLPGDSDEKMKEWLDYDEGHLKTSMWMQNNLDMGIAFLLSLRSGQDGEKYMAFKKQTRQTQQQYELGAALVKKYQMKLSLEMMFITGMAMLYGPIAYEAQQDRNAVLRTQEKEEKPTAKTVKMVKDDAA